MPKQRYFAGKTHKHANYTPKPLFDTLKHLISQYKQLQAENSPQILDNWLKHCLVANITLPDYTITDYKTVLFFLYSYRGSPDTFNSYRRELERLIQWCWFVKNTSIIALKRVDIEEFIEFCQNPPKRWIGIKIVARFINKNDQRIVNKEWRPFIAKISKKAHKDGQKPTKNDYELSQQGIKSLFAILSSFYNYLIQEDLSEINPVLQIRQKSKFIRKEQHTREIRRLSEIQWQTVIKTAVEMANESPETHERTLFIMNALYGMYLRISELAETARWSPKMCDFYRDSNDFWWFKTVGKGNKARQIAVSRAMLNALKRWRKHLGLSSLPAPDDQSPLIIKAKGSGAIASTRIIRNIVQTCFDKAIEKLQAQKLNDEAEMLRSATVHWLRHTGISDDVKIRPKEHVRDDAGHSSSAITDRYIDVELQERAKSARKKEIMRKDDD